MNAGARLRRFYSMLVLAIGAGALSGCWPFPNPGEIVRANLDVETATIVEQRISLSDGTMSSSSIPIASLSGSPEHPCIEIRAYRAATAGNAGSAIVLDVATGEAYKEAYDWSDSPYTLYFYNDSRYLVGRSGTSGFSTLSSYNCEVVAPGFGSRFLTLEGGLATVYAYESGGISAKKSLDAALLTGDMRDYPRIAALPDGGYAVAAYDDSLQASVCSFLGEELGRYGLSHSFGDSSWGYNDCWGSGADGAFYSFDFSTSDLNGFFFRVDETDAVPVRTDFTLSWVPEWSSRPVWAGDRVWIYGGERIQCAESSGAVQSYRIEGIGAMGILGLQDGGILAYWPLEPSRRYIPGHSPPYSYAEPLSLWRYDAACDLVWKREWLPVKPSRFLGAGSSLGSEETDFSVFICERD